MTRHTVCTTVKIMIKMNDCFACIVQWHINMRWVLLKNYFSASSVFIPNEFIKVEIKFSLLVYFFGYTGAIQMIALRTCKLRRRYSYSMFEYHYYVLLNIYIIRSGIHIFFFLYLCTGILFYEIYSLIKIYFGLLTYRLFVLSIKAILTEN